MKGNDVLLRRPYRALVFLVLTATFTSAPVLACGGSNEGGLHWVSEWLASQHYVVGSGDVRDTTPRDDAMEYWRDFRMYETSLYPDTICDTQMYMNVNYPGFGTTESWYSNKQNGCSWVIQTKVVPSGFVGCYGNSVYFGYWWYSNATGNQWNEIGVMKR